MLLWTPRATDVVRKVLRNFRAHLAYHAFNTVYLTSLFYSFRPYLEKREIDVEGWRLVSHCVMFRCASFVEHLCAPCFGNHKHDGAVRCVMKLSITLSQGCKFAVRILCLFGRFAFSGTPGRSLMFIASQGIA